MKYFQIPCPIRLKNLFTDEDGELVTFAQIAVHWANDPVWSEQKANLASLVLVIGELRKPPLAWVALENADHALLARAVEARSPQPPPVLIQIQPFFDAILKAVSEKPEGV